MKKSSKKITKTDCPVISAYRLAHPILNKAFRENVPVKVLHDKSGLSLGTLYNLRNGITKFPRFQTITELGKAMGMELGWSDSGNELTKAKDVKGKFVPNVPKARKKKPKKTVAALPSNVIPLKKSRKAA